MKQIFKSVDAQQRVRRIAFLFVFALRQLGQLSCVLGKNVAIFAGLVILLLVSTPVFAQNSPVAGDDIYTTDEGTLLTVVAPGVLGDDTDVLMSMGIA